MGLPKPQTSPEIQPLPRSPRLPLGFSFPFGAPSLTSAVLTYIPGHGCAAHHPLPEKATLTVSSLGSLGHNRNRLKLH